MEEREEMEEREQVEMEQRVSSRSDLRLSLRSEFIPSVLMQAASDRINIINNPKDNTIIFQRTYSPSNTDRSHSKISNKSSTHSIKDQTHSNRDSTYSNKKSTHSKRDSSSAYDRKLREGKSADGKSKFHTDRSQNVSGKDSNEDLLLLDDSRIEEKLKTQQSGQADSIKEPTHRNESPHGHQRFVTISKTSSEIVPRSQPTPESSISSPQCLPQTPPLHFSHKDPISESNRMKLLHLSLPRIVQQLI